MQRNQLLTTVLLCLLAFGFGWVTAGGRLPGPGVARSKPAAAVYVYEKDAGGVPPGVSVGLDKLNAAGIVATAIDDDVVNADGQIPKQYEKAIPAAREAGLPCLVMLGASGVLNVMPDPKTESDVLEAAR